MVKILISCFIGISLSIALSWIIFQTEFFSNLMRSLLGHKQYEDWNTRFNRLIGDKASEIGLSLRGRKGVGPVRKKEEPKVSNPKNWQKETFSRLKGSSSVISFIKAVYEGEKSSLNKINKIVGLEPNMIQSYIREILTEEFDFSFFNNSTIIEYFALRSHLSAFRTKRTKSSQDRSYALMGIYLSKSGISDKQLSQYWQNNKSSIQLKFKARSAKQFIKIEKELAYQFLKIATLEINIDGWIKRIENTSFKSNTSSKKTNEKKRKDEQATSNLSYLNPEKYQDALKIFDLNKVSNKSSLKKQYRKLALQFHPDRAKNSEKTKAHKNFVQIQKAYETLQKYAA